MTFHKQYTHALSMQKQTQCLSLMSNAGGFGESKTAMSCHVVQDMQKDTGEHKIERRIQALLCHMLHGQIPAGGRGATVAAKLSQRPCAAHLRQSQRVRRILPGLLDIVIFPV